MDKMLSLMDAFVNNAKVEELEKIKTEIQKEADYLKQQRDYGRAYGMEIAIEYIDEHIDSLKGGTE